MHTLAIDIETYSSIDLKKCGVHKYVESPDFEILLFAYSIDGAAIACHDFTSNVYSHRDTMGVLATWLTKPTIKKTAWNAAFERACIAKFFGIELPAEQWECSMVKATMLGLPGSLDMVSQVLKLSETKDAAGKALIKYFSIPCKPTKVNGGRTRNLPEHDPAKWQQFIEYCRQDVLTEQAVRDRISFFEIPAKEAKLWALDQKINDRGILIDTALVTAAVAMDTEVKERLDAEARQLSGLSNPNSTAQLRAWLSAEMDSEVLTLRKADIPVLQGKSDSATVTRMLGIRQEMAKTSVKKYLAMLLRQCADGRAKGIHQYYGAGRTGRWAGRGFQPQNLPRNVIEALDWCRRQVLAGNTEWLGALYGSVPDVLSQLIRTAIVAPKGHKLRVADFSAIEAVVIAWLSGEQWRLDVFNGNGKIYEASASKMFNIPLDTIVSGHANYHYRQIGKVAELALGYQGSVGALETMCTTYKIDIPKKDRPGIVKAWRAANPAIAQLWKDVDKCAIEAVRFPSDKPHSLMIAGTWKLLLFQVVCGVLFITLPSGRQLAYLRPKVVVKEMVGFKYSKAEGIYETGDIAHVTFKQALAMQYKGLGEVNGETYNRTVIQYEGTTEKGIWGTVYTYGGKLVENIVQAIARDCLAEAMLRADAAGYNIVMHVHDEIVAEMPDDKGSVQELCAILAQPIEWAPGLPLKAAGYETDYYKKD